MYCRKCGNKTGETDHYCQVCGTPTGYQEASDAAAETTEMKEEIVFNPPYDNKSQFIEESLPGSEDSLDPNEAADSSDPNEAEADLKEYISENEIEEQKMDETMNPGASKENEFTWNIYQFPSSKKTEEVVFNWNMADFNQPQPKETEPVPFEEEFFQEIREDANRIKEQNIDRFFTFSKKNEEFQELLDREYEKLNKHTEPDQKGNLYEEADIIEEASNQEIHINLEAASDDEVVTNEDKLEASSEDRPDEETAEEAETAAEVIAIELEAETEPAADNEPETEEAKVEETEPTLVTLPTESVPKAEHISEMSEARAQFFGGELIQDNESIKKKLETETEVVEESTPLPESDETGNATAPPSDINADEEKEEEDNHKRSIGQILMIILAIILFVEIVILGIRFFAPESAAAKVINNTQTQIFKTLAGWSDGIKDMFSGNDSNEDKTTPDVKDTDQEGQGQEEPSGEKPGDSAAEKPVPDPNPTKDKNALISSQMVNNNNIVQVKANEALAYQASRNYGQTDINNSKPITNNIWQVPESGNPVYYDQAVVGTIIAFDSQWIDYVNEGSKSVLDLLKKDSDAYRKALAFTKVGKIKETFNLLEIGEIRQGGKGFYIWTHEEIQITEKGVVTDKKYNWIYYLEPTDGKMQIVNFIKF